MLVGSFPEPKVAGIILFQGQGEKYSRTHVYVQEKILEMQWLPHAGLSGGGAPEQL